MTASRALKIDPEDIQPLREKIRRYVVQEGSCWIWQGYCNKRGYGRMRWRSRRSDFAHRMSHAAHIGPIPAGMVVMHRCDNPPCVNPAHLSLGTHADNMADAARKGRIDPNRGEKNGYAKLSDVQVDEIRTRYAAGETLTSLAPQYGVSRPHLSRIVNGQRRGPNPLESDQAGLSSSEVKTLRLRHYESGISLPQLAEETGLRLDVVTALVKYGKVL